MNNIEILHKFAEAYSTLMGLLVKENGMLHLSTEKMLRDISTSISNETRMDDINNGILVLSDKEYDEVEKIYLTLLQAIEVKYDSQSILSLADSTKQILSRFVISPKKEQSITIKTIYNRVTMNASISEEIKMRVENLSKLIYKL